MDKEKLKFTKDEKYKNKKWLYEQYITKEMSTHKIGKKCRVHASSISDWLRKLNIKIRTGSEARRLFIKNNPHFQSGKKHSNWRGGKFISTQGYVMIYNPNHPRASAGKRYVPEHILIAESVLGRYLKVTELIHHLNGNKADNRNANFLTCTQSYHLWLERKMADLYKKEHFQ